MKVQAIQTERGKRWIILDDNYAPIEEVVKYLKFLDSMRKAPNTIKSYAYI